MNRYYNPPTLGSGVVWPLLAPRLAKYLKPRLGRTVNMPLRKQEITQAANQIRIK